MDTVTHETFAAALESVERGAARFVIPTYTRTTIVDARCVAKWRQAGREVLALDSDGRGFRLGRGRGADYVLAGGLRLQGRR